MKISEVQSKLSEIMKEHGDLDCVVFDGMDPCDRVVVMGVETCEPSQYLWGEKDKAAFIYG